MTDERDALVLRLTRDVLGSMKGVNRQLDGLDRRMQRIERLTDETRELLHQVIGVSVIAGNRTEAYEERFDAFEARLAKLEAQSEDA